MFLQKRVLIVIIGFFAVALSEDNNINNKGMLPYRSINKINVYVAIKKLFNMVISIANLLSKPKMLKLLITQSYMFHKEKNVARKQTTKNPLCNIRLEVCES